MKNQSNSLLWGIFLLTVFIPYADASRDTDRSSRLSLVRKATGQTSSAPTGSYSNHVDSILNQTRFETDRMYVDDAIPHELPMVQPEPTEEELVEISAKATAQGKAQSKVDALVPDNNSKAGQKIKADEASVRQALEKQKEEDAKKAALEAEKKALEEKETAKEAETQPDRKGLRPSLAQNPFYFSEESRKGFSDNKSVIVSRLMQRGYTKLEAHNIVDGSTSPEELILNLMQNEGMAYGEAQDYASV